MKNESKRRGIIKTGINFLDENGAVEYGAISVLTGPAASGKTTKSIQIAINLGYIDNKKVLYLSSKEHRLSNELAFLRMITEQHGKKICRKHYELYFDKEKLKKIDSEDFNVLNMINIAIVARELKDLNVNFASFDGKNFAALEHLLEEDDYDVVIIDSGYTLHQTPEVRLSQQEFCSKLCKASYPQAFVVTAPLSYRELKYEEDVCREDLERSKAGKVLSQNAKCVIGLKVFYIHEDDESKTIAVL